MGQAILAPHNLAMVSSRGAGGQHWRGLHSQLAPAAAAARPQACARAKGASNPRAHRRHRLQLKFYGQIKAITAKHGLNPR